LRISYGKVAGYEEDTTLVPYKTTFFGLYDRAESFGEKPPYDLPARYKEGRGKLDLATPFNFVYTADTIGGNSGSPVINRNAELVGLNFDSNIQKLSNRYWYIEAEEGSRAVAVHSAAILEALRKLYDATDLVKELTGNNFNGTPKFDTRSGGRLKNAGYYRETNERNDDSGFGGKRHYGRRKQTTRRGSAPSYIGGQHKCSAEFRGCKISRFERRRRIAFAFRRNQPVGRKFKIGEPAAEGRRSFNLERRAADIRHLRRRKFGARIGGFGLTKQNFAAVYYKTARENLCIERSFISF
jgi:hypothetical protein